jgi:erythromycin esterase
MNHPASARIGYATLARIIAAIVIALATGAAVCACRGEARRPPEPPRPLAIAPRETPASIAGEVLTASGDPVAGAVVSVWSHFDPETRDPALDATSNDRGQFRFAGVPAGRCAVTATFDGKATAYSGVLEVRADAPTMRLTLRLSAARRLKVEGVVRDESGAPVSNARLIAASFSENEDEVYVTRADSNGHYLYALPEGVAYLVVADAPPRARAYRRVDDTSPTADLTLLEPPAPRPSDDVILAWLRARATPLTSAGSLTDTEARAFVAMTGDAPLVGMGEATHGSAEFPDWRRKVFEALVRNAGFTVYAIEAGWPDAFALDEYVLHGRGDPEAAVKAIRGLNAWTHETTETLALVNWMHDYNAITTHKNKVHFEAFDVFTPHAVPRLIAYLTKVDPAAVDAARVTLAPFANIGCDITYPALAENAKAATRRAVDALLATLDANHRHYAARSSEAEWARARHLARHIQQAEASYRDESLREPYMAENIRWLVDHHAPGTRFLLSAHNAHIAASGHSDMDAGRLLRKEWGPRYVAIGFSFGQGTTRALDWRNGRQAAPLRTFEVPRARSSARAQESSFDEALGLAGLSAFVVDLRAADASIAAWLRSPQLLHNVRGGYEGPDHVFETFAPSRAFDAMIYVENISASHALALAK